MWLLKELMCRRRKSGQADTIATLDLMRADMTVRFHGEQIWIPSSDGFRIDAMLIPPPPTPASSATATAGRTSTAVNDTERRAVIICNPNGGLYEFHHLQMDWIQFYTSLGCHVLVYNYRGYGRNAGSPSPLDHNRDGLAIVNFLKTQRGMAKIAVHGESIGVCRDWIGACDAMLVTLIRLLTFMVFCSETNRVWWRRTWRASPRTWT